MFPLNTFSNLCIFFLLLMIYSAAGWVGEMVYCSVGKGHICEKRGFLNGFICPIYGHGALLVLYVLHGGFKNPVLTFLGGMVLTTALEYFTSWFMEKLFHMRWWDYSKKKIQINGRVCLLNSVLFGLACVLLCHVVNPPVMAWLFRVGDTYTIPAASFLFGIYLMDNVLSVRSAIQLSNRAEKLHEVQQKVRQHLAAAAQSLGDKAAENRERYLQSVDNMTRDFMEGTRTQQLMEHYDEEEAKRLQKKIAKNQFDFNDFLSQIHQIKKMGNLKELASMIPGVGKAIKDIDIDDNAFKSIEAIIYSMTPQERTNPEILNGTRRTRIAKGSGTSIQEVNRLLKQFDQTRKMMKMVTGSKMGKMMPKLKK